ncbi:MAG TPA: helix-turn-helix domain-containing protein [Acidobacteriota bacterium]|nr:helix-turn-helix domain-containing protein [Acidobacteriota bacterium]
MLAEDTEEVTYNRKTLLTELDMIFSETPGKRLSDIAREMGVDRHTIENAVRTRKNCSFRDYRRDALLKAARAMLAQPGLSIKEIGGKLGYASGASFSRFIRQATGSSPSRLREGSPDGKNR